MKDIQIVECPRDAMQGFQNPIPTSSKIKYLQKLLEVGFDTIDCGSFVSPRAVPQLADTEEVLKGIDKSGSVSRLLTIVANERGAERAVSFDEVDILGYPFSISETFQIRNTRQTIEKSLKTLQNVMRTAGECKKKLLVYLSMGFGNPYGDEWNTGIAAEWCRKLRDMGVEMINLSDTIGNARPDDIRELCGTCLHELDDVELGIHLHTRPGNHLPNIRAAYESGCRKFDSAIRGFGGCQFASDHLTGNLPTEVLVEFLEEHGVHTGLSKIKLQESLLLSSEVFV